MICRRNTPSGGRQDGFSRRDSALPAPQQVLTKSGRTPVPPAALSTRSRRSEFLLVGLFPPDEKRPQGEMFRRSGIQNLF